MKKIALVILFILITSPVFAKTMPGEEGVTTMSMTAACRTQEYHDEFKSANLAKDTQGILEMLTSGKCFPVKKRTEVLVIESGWTILKVRILSGEYKGKAGWIYREAVY